MPSALLLTLSSLAFSAGQSVDIEVVHPTFSPGLPVGVDSPEIAGAGAVRAGTFVQYVRDPLVLYEYGAWSGRVIEHRLSATMGASWDLRHDLSLRVSAPAIAQWGTDLPDLAAEIAGFGDLTVGGRWAPYAGDSLRLATRADLALPVGVQSSWIGEAMPRLHLGGMAAYALGGSRLYADAGFTFRAPVDTEANLTLGQEFTLAAGASTPLLSDRVSASTSAISRVGLTSWHGTAELPLELTAALHTALLPGWGLDLGVGKGLGYGYGTSAARAFAGLRWTQAPPSEEIIIAIDDPDALPEALPEAELPPEEPVPDDAWGDGQRARLVENRIEIRQPIHFELDTDVLVADSLPTLEAIADILDSRGDIGEVLVEGHASEEGSFAYNYDLSSRRAGTIFRTLVEFGVHPKRLSTRGMGEVEPSADGLEASRRVEFHVVRWITDGVAPYPLVSVIALPWSGAQAEVTWPTPPPKQAENLDSLQYWSPVMGDESACGEDVRDLIAEAEEGARQDGDRAQIADALLRAERGMACSPRVSGELLARYWLAAGAVAALQGDDPRAQGAIAAALQVQPELSAQGYPTRVGDLLHAQRDVRPNLGWLTVQAPPDWWVAVDGHLVEDTRAVPEGFHLVQAGQGPRAGFARVIPIEAARETVVRAAKEPVTADVFLASTAHNPWAEVAPLTYHRQRPGLTADVPWPVATPPEAPDTAEVQPPAWSPFPDPSAVFRPDVPLTPLQAFVRGLDSRDLTMGASASGAAALGLGMAAMLAKSEFENAESWGQARTYARANHAAVISGGALGVASAALMSWAVVEGRW